MSVCFRNIILEFFFRCALFHFFLPTNTVPCSFLSQSQLLFFQVFSFSSPSHQMPPYLLEPRGFILNVQLVWPLPLTNFSHMHQSHLLIMRMVLSSNIFVQPFIALPSHILLQFQSYHLRTPSSLPSLFVHQLPIQYSCPFRIYFKPLPQPPASIFFSPPIPFITCFYFLVPLYLVFPLLSLKVQPFAPMFRSGSFPLCFAWAVERCYLEQKKYLLVALSSSMWIQPKTHNTPERKIF